MEESKLHIEEKLIEGKNGLIFLIQNTLLVLISIFLFIMGIIMVDNNSSVFYGVILIVP